ncbi:uncharacterized protein LOC126416692 [Schistocerca serialis cubense]|uniref:uncharacterized protein LOC126416692 n=1 Tax=Schistocerca serialis cubense TaxID=2023355 RepID=UPI00214EFEB7|nr:uncharacterized protein LOC126416692 [Schistocerca serialis cubense]
MADTARQSQELLGPSSVALSWIGVWRPPGGRRPGFRLLGAIFIATTEIAICSLTAVQMLIDTPTDPEVFREVFFICTCGFSWFVKLVSFVAQWRRLQRMVLSLLDAKIRFPDNGTGVRERYTRTAYSVWRWWQSMPAVTVMLWMADPFIQNLTSPPAENGTRPLIFWIPVEVQHSPAYEITYAIEAFCIGSVSETSILLDIFLIILIVSAAGEIAVLNENIAGMRLSNTREREKVEPDKGLQALERSIDEVSISQTAYVFSEYSSDIKRNLFVLDRHDTYWKLHSSLVKNIQHHEVILTYINDLEIVLSASVYVLLLTNALNICLHSFGIVALFQEGATSSTVFKEVISFASFLAQTGLFCFIGQLIIDQADRLQFSAFSCDWPQADESFCRSLRIFMLQAACPLSVRVGKLVELSRNSFLQAMNASYTIFNMLFNLQTAD